jgi:arylsulfatase A-like enzyme
MTGRYAHNHGVRDNDSAQALDERSSMQRYLHDAGYRTAIFGKYLNNWDLDQSPPFFDDWAIFAQSRASYDPAEWNVRGTRHRVSEYGTSFVESRALRFLERSEQGDDSPWFLYLSPPAAHFPYTPEHRYARAPVSRWTPNPAVSETDRSDKPGFMDDYTFTIDKARRARTRQLRTLMSVDDLVGHIFEKMRNLDEMDHLIAIYLSDNGYLWGEHGFGGEIHGKGIPYINSVRIPLLVRWPRAFEAGTRDGRLVATIDIAPTIMKAAELAPDKRYPLDGRPLTDDGRRGRLLIESWRNETFVGLPSWASTLTKDYQYIEYYRNGESVSKEYYDLEADPWQLDNALGNPIVHDDVETRSLSRRLRQDRRCEGAACP